MLLEELEKATARLGFLERYKENVQQEIAKIKVKVDSLLTVFFLSDIPKLET